MIHPRLSILAASTLLLFTAPIKSDKILFEPCLQDSSGIVSSVDISPCERSTANEACRFRYGEEYTITSTCSPFIYTSCMKLRICSDEYLRNSRLYFA